MRNVRWSVYLGRSEKWQWMELQLKCSIEPHGFDIKKDLEMTLRVVDRAQSLGTPCQLSNQRKRLIGVHHCRLRVRLRFGNGEDDVA